MHSSVTWALYTDHSSLLALDGAGHETKKKLSVSYSDIGTKISMFIVAIRNR